MEQQGNYGEEVRRYRSRFKMTLIIINFCFSSFYIGYTLSYFGSIPFPFIKQIYGIRMSTSTADGLLSGCVPVGAGIGAALSSLIIRNLSRKNSILLVNAVAFVVGMLILIRVEWLLFMCRFLQGVCTGAFSAIIPMVVKEMSPVQISGSLGVLHQFFIAFGILFAYLLEHLLRVSLGSHNNIWWLVFSFTLLTILIQTLNLIFLFPYETPKYLLLNLKEDQAREVIFILYKDEFVLEVYEEKKFDLAKIYHAQFFGREDQILAEEDMIAPPPPPTLTKRLTSLIETRSTLDFPFILAIFLAFSHQMSGVNILVNYGPLLVGKILPDISNIITILISLLSAIATLFASFILRVVGRRKIYLVGALSCAVTLGLVAIGFFIKSDQPIAKMTDQGQKDWAIIMILIGIFSFKTIFGITLGPVMWLYISEIVQPKRMAYPVLSHWISASLVITLFPIIGHNMQGHNPATMFVFFSLFQFFSFWVIYKFVIETKGKTQRQIISDFQRIGD